MTRIGSHEEHRWNELLYASRGALDNRGANRYKDGD